MEVILKPMPCNDTHCDILHEGPLEYTDVYCTFENRWIVKSCLSFHTFMKLTR